MDEATAQFIEMRKIVESLRGEHDRLQTYQNIRKLWNITASLKNGWETIFTTETVSMLNEEILHKILNELIDSVNMYINLTEFMTDCLDNKLREKQEKIREVEKSMAV